MAMIRGTLLKIFCFFSIFYCGYFKFLFLL